MGAAGFCATADEALCGKCRAGCQCFSCESGDSCNCSCRPLIALGLLIVIIATLIAFVSLRCDCRL